MPKPQKRIMRDIKLNDPVAVELPAHVWVGFIAAYSATRWQAEDASAIALEAIEKIFDPVWMKEREAANSEHNDLSQALMRAAFIGQMPQMPGIPEMPPDDEPGEKTDD